MHACRCGVEGRRRLWLKVRLEVTEELDAKTASKPEAACCIKSQR